MQIEPNTKKRALVTGANRGIGLAIARSLAAAECHVIFGARDLDAAARAADGLDASIVELDLSSDASIRAAVESAGQVDILVNNAGVLGDGDVLSDPVGFDEAMAVRVRGPFLLMQNLFPGMQDRGFGRVVNVSSGWGAFSDGVAGPGAYGVAKAALNALTVSASRNMPRNVKINAMCPGWVRTRMGGASAPRSPQQAANTAVWLTMLDEQGPTGGFFRDRKRIAW